MNLITVNQSAMAAALDFVMGPEARMALENLYTIIDNAERRGVTQGFNEGITLDKANAEEDKRDAFNAGYDLGTEYPQPDLSACAGFHDAQPDDSALGQYDMDCNALPPMQEQRDAVAKIDALVSEIETIEQQYEWVKTTEGDWIERPV